MSKIIVFPVVLLLASIQAAHAAECVFPASNDAAPSWVCDEPVSGYEVSFAGQGRAIKNDAKNSLPPFQQAVMDILSQAAYRHQEKVSPTIQLEKNIASNEIMQEVNVVFGSDTGFVSRRVLFEISEFEISGDAKPKKPIDRVMVTQTRVTMSCPNAYTAWRYVRSAGLDDAESVFQSSRESGNRCSNEEMLKALSAAGIRYIHSVISPQGDFYLLLGSKKASDLKIRSMPQSK